MVSTFCLYIVTLACLVLIHSNTETGHADYVKLFSKGVHL